MRYAHLAELVTTVLEDYLAALTEPEVRRLTGAPATFERPKIEAWLATREEHHDRADWAVLNHVDLDNESANYRVWLAGPQVFGHGYGTEITQLVVGYALGTCGLHRVSLGVFDFNPRAQRVYQKCGFSHEGRLRNAVRWEGQWHDELLMAILSTDPRPAN
jgi:RimJ/RimL family protein N-acetyltransferase